MTDSSAQEKGFEDRAAEEFWNDLKEEFGAENVRRYIRDEIVITVRRTYLKDGWLDRLLSNLRVTTETGAK